MSGRRSSMSRARSSSRGRADTTQQRGRAPSIHDPYLGPNHGGYPAAADPYSDPRLYGSGADSDRSSYPSSRDASLYGDPYSRSPASAPEFRRESSSEGSRDDAGRSVSEPLRTRPAVAPRGGPNSAILDRIRSDPNSNTYPPTDLPPVSLYGPSPFAEVTRRRAPITANSYEYIEQELEPRLSRDERALQELMRRRGEDAARRATYDDPRGQGPRGRPSSRNGFR